LILILQHVQTKEFARHIPTTEDRFAKRNQSVIIEGFTSLPGAPGSGLGSRNSELNTAQSTGRVLSFSVIASMQWTLGLDTAANAQECVAT
jgi:hypothetical protein